MLRRRIIFTLMICLSILVSGVTSHAEEEIEDLVDIFESKGRIVAVLEGRKTVRLDLRRNEEIVWRGSEGYLGAFLTNKRFFAISSSSNTWHELSLRADESDNGTAFLSPHIALLVTSGRAIGFDATTRRFVETQLAIRDELLAAEIEKHVAVVITSGRALAFAVGRSSFSEIDLRLRETINEMKITSSKAILRTSERLLIFNARAAAWNEQTLY